jgi:hypothetical protein
MSEITPDASTVSRPSPTFNRPVAPAPNIDRDAEMLNYYFDSTWTTKDIADHFKLSVSVVAAWFQRPDIVALIDFVTAANDRRARDIARENLPGTIDVLLRISRVRNDDKVSRAACSALIQFSRARATAAVIAKRAAKQTQAKEDVQLTSSDRLRRANPFPSRSTQASDAPSPHQTPSSNAPDQHRDDDTWAVVELDHAHGRSPDAPRSMPPVLPCTASNGLHPGESAPDPLVLHSLRPHDVAG